MIDLENRYHEEIKEGIMFALNPQISPIEAYSCFGILHGAYSRGGFIQGGLTFSCSCSYR